MDCPSQPYSHLEAILKKLEHTELDSFKQALKNCSLPETLKQIPQVTLNAASGAQLAEILREYCPRGWVEKVAMQILQEINRADLAELVVKLLKETSSKKAGKKYLPFILTIKSDLPVLEPNMNQEIEKEEHRMKKEWEKVFRKEWKYNFWPKCKESMYVETESYRTLMTLCNPKAEMPFAHVIVLHGPPGSGKTTMAKRLMLQWSESKQAQMFPCAFYISCRNINDINSCTFINLLSMENNPWRHFVMKSLNLAKQFLFVVDGLDELKAPTGALINDICGDWNIEKPAAVLLGSLLKRKLAPHATLLVTTRTQALRQIHLLIDQPTLLEIQGFSDQDKQEYFRRFFKDEEDHAEAGDDELGEEEEGHAEEEEGHAEEEEGHAEEEEGHAEEEEGHAEEEEGHAEEEEGHAEEEEGHAEEEEGHAEEEEGHAEEEDGEEKALRAFNAVRYNPDLFHMASLPAACVVFSICLHQVMKKREDLALTCQTHTSMFLKFLCGIFSPENYESRFKKGIETTFKKLCTLAADSLLEQLPIFCEEDILKLQLNLKELHPFVCRNVLDKGRFSNCFSFFYLSIQQLMAAIKFIQELEQEGKGVSKYSIQNMLSREARLKNPNLSGVLLFAFGLLNETRIKELVAVFDCQISIAVKRKFLECEAGENKPFLLLMDLQEILSCLYESQEKGLVKEAMALFEEISLPLKTNTDLIHASFCLKNSQNLQTMSLQVVKGLFPENDAALGSTAQDQRSQDNQPQDNQHLLTFWTDLCDLFHSNEKLVFLDISDSYFSSSSLQILYTKLSSAPRHLQKVVLKNISPADVYKKLCLIFTGYITLSHLTLKGDDMSTVLPPLGGLVKNSLCNLKYLSVSSCPDDLQKWNDFFQALKVNESLTCLDLTDNKLLDKGAKLLCKTWKQPKSKLQRVSLENCHLTGSCCKDLASILMVSQTLTHLNLAKNNLGNGGVKTLCESLSYPECKLQTLVLWSCNITSKGCHHLSKMLREALHLEHLDLGLNQIGSEGARLLCNALKEPQSNLKSLWLCGCSIAPVNCKDFSETLRSNKSLNTLDLAQNSLGTDAIKTFCGDLKLRICPLQTLRLKFDNTNQRIQNLIQEMKVSHPQLTINSDQPDPKKKEPSFPHFIF